MQYITSLLSSTPPPPTTTSPLKVRVDSSVVEVEYTTACSTFNPARDWCHLDALSIPSVYATKEPSDIE